MTTIASRPLRFFAYAWGEVSDLPSDTQMGVVQQLADWGFITNAKMGRAEDAAGGVIDVDVAAVSRLRADSWQPLADEHGVTIVYEGPDSAHAAAVEGAVGQIVDFHAVVHQ